MVSEVSTKPVLDVSINLVKIGERARKDLGDIGALASSIESIGLLQPIGIDPNYKLIFGERRLRAFEQLGRESIPARIVHVPSLLLAEHAENEIRKDFSSSERVAIAKAIEDELRDRRKQGERNDLKNQHAAAMDSRLGLEFSDGPLPVNLPEVTEGETREIAAEKAGFGSEKTYRDAKAVVEKADPALIEAMDSKAVSISTAAKLATAPVEVQRAAAADPKKAVELAKQASAAKVREIKQAATDIADATRDAKKTAIVEHLEAVAAREVEAPTGLFDVIVIDPPWDMQKIERDVRPNQTAFDYPTMSEEELSALSLPADDDCHVWVWTTHKFLPMSLRLIETWGLKYVCTFVWHKPGGFQPIGLPQYNAEFAVYARKGSPKFVDTKAFNTCFSAPRGAHSEKPEEFYDMVRRVTGGRRIDMFNRRKIDGFSTWGKEAAA